MRQWLEDVEARHGIDKLTLRSRQLVLASFAILLVLVIYRGFLVQGDEFNWRPVVAFVLPLVLFCPPLLVSEHAVMHGSRLSAYSILPRE